MQLKFENPDAKIIAHPECEEIVLEKADFVKRIVIEDDRRAILVQHTPKGDIPPSLVLVKSPG